MHKVPAALPAADDLDTARLILRDGTTATVRPATRDDRALLIRFFNELSLESRWRRFLSVTLPDTHLVDQLVAAAGTGEGLTLIALRSTGGDPRIIAVASYLALNGSAADVSFAVEVTWIAGGVICG